MQTDLCREPLPPRGIAAGAHAGRVEVGPPPMTRRGPIATILLAIAIIVVADVLLSRYTPHVAVGGLVATIVVVAVAAYIVGSIAMSRGVRLPTVPKVRRRPRLRVVERDPAKAASDFIKQFEQRSKR